jgi:hypothetical protein
MVGTRLMPTGTQRVLAGPEHDVVLGVLGVAGFSRLGARTGVVGEGRSTKGHHPLYGECQTCDYFPPRPKSHPFPLRVLPGLYGASPCTDK